MFATLPLNMHGQTVFQRATSDKEPSPLRSTMRNDRLNGPALLPFHKNVKLHYDSVVAE